MSKRIMYWVSVGGLPAGYLSFFVMLLWGIAAAYAAPTNYVP